MLDRTSEAVATAEIILEAGDLNDALRRVRHAMCKEETRYYLNGVYLHYALREDVLRFVATDGHRLAMADIPAPQGSINIRPVILSRGFIADAIKATSKTGDAFKHVRLAIWPNRSTLTDWAGNAIDGALVDGTFPDYERVNQFGLLMTLPQARAALAACSVERYDARCGREWSRTGLPCAFGL